MPRKTPSSRPIRRSFDLKEDLLERLKDASAATGVSLNVIAEQAFESELGHLAAAHNGGKPFPQRDPASTFRRMAPRRSA